MIRGLAKVNVVLFGHRFELRLKTAKSIEEGLKQNVYPISIGPFFIGGFTRLFCNRHKHWRWSHIHNDLFPRIWDRGNLSYLRECFMDS